MTIAQQLKVKEFPFEIKDKNGNLIYFETSNGFWHKSEYDSNGNLIYFEESKGYWEKREYESYGNLIYYKNSKGEITDNRIKFTIGDRIQISSFSNQYILSRVDESRINLINLKTGNRWRQSVEYSGFNPGDIIPYSKIQELVGPDFQFKKIK